MKDHEFECKECHGTGIVRHSISNNDINIDQKSNFVYSCWICQGTGKLDWIENIIGRKIPKGHDIWYAPSGLMRGIITDVRKANE